MISKDNVLSVLEQTEEKEQRFFAAWKLGVVLVGPHLFGPNTLASAKRKEDLRPDAGRVCVELAKESCGEEQFLTAMVSFYDPAFAEELVERIDCHKSFCGLTYNLDHEQVEILCELLRNYQGWADPDPAN
jgi:hypothetical protein